MIASLLSIKTIIMLSALGGLAIVGVIGYFKWKWGKDAVEKVSKQAQEQKSNADDELAQSNAENSTIPSDDKLKWMRENANIKE